MRAGGAARLALLPPASARPMCLPHIGFEEKSSPIQCWGAHDDQIILSIPSLSKK